MNTYTFTCVHLLLFLSSPLHYTRPTIKIRLVIQFSADLNKIINTSKSNLDRVQLFYSDALIKHTHVYQYSSKTLPS